MASNETPESEFSIECFQNYSAPEVFVQGLAGMVNQGEVESIIKAQKVMLQRFEKTTEMLTTCNQLSASRIKNATAEFKRHTQLLLDMKNDLNFIFKKIKAIKSKLRYMQEWDKTNDYLIHPFFTRACYPGWHKAGTQYPEAYKEADAAAAARRLTTLDDDEDEEHPPSTAPRPTISATVSTETLRPGTSKVPRRQQPELAEDAEVPRKNDSSSSETEGPSEHEEVDADSD